jgi:diacylglycerol O-acyltransferase / wax synthase
MWLVNLPISEPDPVKRLKFIQAETKRLKLTNQALGAATLVDLSKGTPLPLLSLANRVAGSAIRPFNMTVTNVPGPQFPMYLLEAKMLANFPIVPLWAQHGMGIALFSYDGRLLWGIHADYDALSDSAAFLRSIHHSMSTLENAAADVGATG